MADGSGEVGTSGSVMLDTMLNLVSGLGNGQDKNMSNTFQFRELTDIELENAFRGDWIARKVVMLPAYDMVRAGRKWQTAKNRIEAIELEEKRLKYWDVLQRTLVRARLYGGAAIIVGAPGNPMDLLTPEMIGKGQIKWLFSVTRHELKSGDLDMDLYSDFFGQPKWYEIQSNTGRTSRIHPSRVIRFTGNELPSNKLSHENWGDSVLQAVADAVMHAGVAQAGIAGLIQEAKIDVVRIPRLMEALSTKEYTDRLTQRFLYAGLAKSNNNTLILDTEEEWERKAINFTQLPDILKLYLQIAAGAADIPATRLLGQAPAGLNATGESDIRQYYDRIAADQIAWLKPRIEPLDDFMMRSAVGRIPKDVYYIFSPLWQMDEKTAAEVGKLKAETTKIYAENDLVPKNVLVKAVQNQLIEDGQYPGIEDAYEVAEGDPSAEGNTATGTAQLEAPRETGEGGAVAPTPPVDTPASQV